MNKQLVLAAIAVFDTYPEANEVLVCEDGNVFLPERRNLAENHCREAKLPAPVLLTKEEALNSMKKGSKAAAKEAEEQAAAEAAAQEAEENAAAEAAAQEAEEDAAAEAATQEAEETAAAELPTQPGLYADKDGAHWLLTKNGNWSWKKTGAAIDRSGNEPMHTLAPFVLVQASKGAGK